MKQSPFVILLFGLCSVLFWSVTSNALAGHARRTQGFTNRDFESSYRVDMVPVNPPSFNTTDVGYYSSWVWPTAGWELIWGNPGDGNSNPAATAAGAVVKRTGMYSATGTNIVEAWCDPNYYWIYEGTGIAPFEWIFHDASTTQTNGNCFFAVTIGTDLRQPISGAPIPPSPAPTTPYSLPSATPAYAFDVATFANHVKNALNGGNPAPVGFQLAVRDPNGNLIYSSASGSVTGSSSLPATTMTKNRRIDTASMSKTIMATAVMAALEDLADHKPALGVTLDSSIQPYVPSNWDRSKINNVTFRSLLRHTSGFIANGGDAYAQVKTISNPPGAIRSWPITTIHFSIIAVGRHCARIQFAPRHPL